jgi:hypothetical protein
MILFNNKENIMENLFEKFIKEEYEWIYEDGDNANLIIEGFDGEISEDEFYEHFDEFMNQAVDQYCNSEYIIQTMHDNMHDELIDVVKQYLNNRDEE